MNNLSTIDWAVFQQVCHSAQDWHSNIVTSKDVQRRMDDNISLYAVRKSLKALESAELIEKASQGFAPSCSPEGEWDYSEPIPPRNGWAVTRLGQDTEEWRKAEYAYTKGLADWANGRYDEEE